MQCHALLLLASAIAFLSGCTQAKLLPQTPTTAADATVNVLPAADVPWTALNPARGDQSPQAATVWGDRGDEVPTGFLVRFVDGFSSPPHIHNVTYRGVVIQGLVHNDDPDAAPMWMPPGSYWTQPAGEVHITAARGEVNMAFIEIAQGPYLVMPPAQAFDNGERPINVDPSNFVWLDAGNTSWIDSPSKGGPKLVHLWGTPADGELNATLLKLPPGFTGHLQTSDTRLNTVVIQGQPTHGVAGKSASRPLAPGSSFESEGRIAHGLINAGDQDAVLYVRAQGKYTVSGEVDPVAYTAAAATPPRAAPRNRPSSLPAVDGPAHEACAICSLHPQASAAQATARRAD